MEVIMNKTQKIVMFATVILLASNYDLFAMKRVAAEDDAQADGAKRRRHTDAAAAAPAAPAPAETKAPTVHALRSPAAPAPAPTKPAEKTETKKPGYVFNLAQINTRLAGIEINNGHFYIQENHEKTTGPQEYLRRELNLLFIQDENVSMIGKRTYAIEPGLVTLQSVHINEKIGSFELRRLGLGTLLIVAALHDPMVQEKNCSKVSVATISRESSALYKKLGFTSISVADLSDIDESMYYETFEADRLQEFLQEKTELLVEETFQKLNERALKDLENSKKA